jgi:hypothetical protein
MEENNNQENNENIENKVENKEEKENINAIEEDKKEENDDKKKEEIDLEETDDGINKEDINNIVDYLTNLDFDKYSRDMEIKEALMVLKTKMDKDHELKEKEQKIENNKVTIIDDNKISNNKLQEENIENNKQTIYKDKFINNVDEKKVNEIKEPKEIIDEEEIKKKQEIEKYKIAEKIAKSDALKDIHSVKSVQKLLMRENVDDQAPLRITVIKENPLANYDDYVPNKLPFLRSLPLV